MKNSRVQAALALWNAMDEKERFEFLTAIAKDCRPTMTKIPIIRKGKK